jgi:HEAT repeat protein
VVRGKPFPKGVSGNPGGRPKISGHVRELAQARTEEAVRTLVEALQDPDGRVRVAAANSILDRGHGKPGAVDEEKVIREELAKMSDEAIEALHAMQVKRLTE